MAKLKFRIAGVDFEYDGDASDVERLIERLLRNTTRFTPSQTFLTTEPLSAKTPLPTPQSELTSRGEIRLRLRPNEEIKQYILDKPRYRHNLFEVQTAFFGKTFKSRGETRHMYHKTARQLRQIRKQIEHEKRGKFKARLQEGGIKQFIFEEEPSQNT